MSDKPHSDPHSSPREFTQVEIEQPLYDFIDMEAYDVVPGPQYRRLVEQLEATQRALREIELRGEQGGRLCDTSHGMWRIASEALNPAKKRHASSEASV